MSLGSVDLDMMALNKVRLYLKGPDMVRFDKLYLDKIKVYMSILDKLNMMGIIKVDMMDLD